MMIKMMQQADYPWFDDKSTPAKETRDDMARKSLSDALQWLTERYGSDPSKWNWGSLHGITFQAQPLGGHPVLKYLYNSNRIPARGHNFTINAASFRYNNPFTMVHGSSQRLIMDLSNFDNSSESSPVARAARF